MNSFNLSKRKLIPTLVNLILPLTILLAWPANTTGLLQATFIRAPRIALSLPKRMIPSNQELVEQRNQVARGKKKARLRSLQESHERNMKFKRLFHDNAKNSSLAENYTVPDMYAVKVSVSKELRQDLKLNGREKRGRLFMDVDSAASQTLKGFKMELHSFFRALRKSTYCLEACLPEVNEDGLIVTTSEDDWEKLESWKIDCDNNVIKTFEAAKSFYAENEAKLKRPSILLRVVKDPNAPELPPPPQYLENMPDPSETENMTMLSFYAFPPSTIDFPDDFAFQLRRKWKPFNALGRVYVAREGVNAQMSVPTNVLNHFMECCRSIPELGQWMENGVNIDPTPIPVKEFATAGVHVNGKAAPPFRNLHIRVRSQVVADGLDKALDWQSSGYDMPPLEWHQKLKEARNNSGDKAPILLDCRNKYETDMGTFERAEPLNTDNFRESWDVIKERLADTPKDAPIMMYCTGGIRCVKVGAYMKQELGFSNVSRLAGGIIAYDRTLNEESPEEELMFKGTNFVFDGRLGRTITDDDFANCMTCGAETSLVSNCLNDNCHKRITQCEKCRTAFHGTCSDACRQRIVNGKVLLQKNSDGAESLKTINAESIQFENLEDYSTGHSSPPPSFYREIEHNTQHFIASGAHMVSGASQGRLLTQFASLTREGRVLELGTFTGYATACLLEGAANSGTAIDYKGTGGRDGGPYVMTLERDRKALSLAVAHLKVMTENDIWENGAEAACALRAKGRDLSLIDDEVVNLTYNDIASCEVIQVTDALATIEAMANKSTGNFHPAPFDMVFIDADKTRLLEYVDALLTNDLILKKGGLILVDNVLWKGLVLEANNSATNSHRNEQAINDKDDGASSRKGRRARKLANKMHKFNSEILKENRVEVVVLPMRDGLSVIRKR